MTDRSKILHVGQGEYVISDVPETMITTVLGSCVSACLWDPEAEVGGMNHILLPDTGGDGRSDAFFAINAMELLVNGLLRAGAAKGRLVAKLFGGARMLTGVGDIGRRNAEMAKGFLEREDIRCVSSSLGGTRGRRLQFWPTTGRARQLYIVGAVPEEAPVQPAKPPQSDLELF